MQPDSALALRVVRRLRAAAGYYELNMRRHALETLDSLSDLGDIGPFHLPEEMLRAEILKAEHRYEAAAETLELAARRLPVPVNQALWLALSDCYRQAGNPQGAANSLACARGAKLPPIAKTE
jgi:hypothetical protein